MCLALTLSSHFRLAGIASGRAHQFDLLMQALQNKVILQNLDGCPWLQAHQTHISCCVNLASLLAGTLDVAHVNPNSVGCRHCSHNLIMHKPDQACRRHCSHNDPDCDWTIANAGTARNGHLAITASRPVSGPEGTCQRAAPVWPPWQRQDHAGKGPVPGSQGHLFQHLSRHSDQQVAWRRGEAGQDAVQGCSGESACHHFHR